VLFSSFSFGASGAFRAMSARFLSMAFDAGLTIGVAV
jgi:hypothetical protein